MWCYLGNQSRSQVRLRYSLDMAGCERNCVNECKSFLEPLLVLLDFKFHLHYKYYHHFVALACMEVQMHVCA